MRFGRLIGVGALAALQLVGAARADTTRTGAAVKIEGARGGVFAAGADVEISGDISPGLRPVTGVLAVGGSVKISASIDGGLAAAGGDVLFTGHAERIFVSGGNVTIGGRVADDAHVAGGNLTVAPEASIGHELHAAGGALDIAGTIGEDAELSGAFVRFNGTVRGDAEISGETVVIGPNARIAGDLTYYATKPADISPEAEIGGEVVFKEASERKFEWEDARRPPFVHGDFPLRAYGALFWFVALGASGALMALVFPRWMGEAAAAGRDKPLTSLAIGFAVLIGLPVAAVLLMIMILGIPFGGFLLALYAGLLAISMIGAGLGAGHMLFDRGDGRQAKFLLFFAGLAIVLVVGAAPLVGGIVTFFAMLLGLGVLFRGLWSALRAEAA